MDLDPARVWDSFTLEERAVFAGLLEDVGFLVDDWPSVAALRDLLEIVAVYRFAARMDGHAMTDAVRSAAEALGMEDDPDRTSAHHPADRFPRKLNRWLAAAEESSGHFVRPPDSEAA